MMGEEVNMKKAPLILLLSAILSIAMIAVGAQSCTAFATLGSQTEFVPGEIIVGLDKISSGALYEIERIGGAILENIVALEAVHVYVPVGMEDAFIENAKSIQGVKYAERNGIYRVAYTPNDPYWSNQWGMRIIQADMAWDIHKGSTSVIVAIVDTGIDYTHNDLSSHYLSLGYDWVNSDNDPKDDHWHGTHCAGIAAAIMDNGVGVVGVAQVSIMAEKVLNAGGSGTWEAVAQGITHAADAGADVISLSLGGTGYSSVVESACTYAWNKGCIIVAAAGNNNSPTLFYPAAYSTVISVAATNINDGKASYSNYGDWIELSAPGGDGSTSEWIFSTYPNNGYAWAQGTSMACPHVSGLAALVWSYDPNLTNQQLRDHLHNTADDLGTPGKDQYFGYGRINAYRALNELGPAPKMHVGDISMWYTKKGAQYTIYTKVPVLGEIGQPVSGATVYLDTILPNGVTQSFSGTTLTDGTVTFTTKSKLKGIYTSTVTNVVKAGWVYDPASNFETSQTLTVP
jgi:subtilisin family serine protease